jgi:voltage-gated potassium channel
VEFTLLFLELFFYGLKLTAPILAFLALIIVILGQIAGRRESWSRLDALYWTFITATTVGYGDYRPLDSVSRILSVLIAFCGVIFTGILVAVAITATTQSIKTQIDASELQYIQGILGD